MARLPHLADQLNLSNRRVARLRAAFWAVENALLTRTLGRARGSIGGSSARANELVETPAAAAEVDRVRVLRWVFSRAADVLTCELALSDDDACYELRTMTWPRATSRSVERFADVTLAFERQSALEGDLVKSGWSLESYESAIAERQRQKSIAI